MPTNVRKNATFTTMVEGVLTDLMLKTTAAQVEVSEGVTLATKIQDLITAINGKSADGHIHATADVTGLDDKLATLATTEAMNAAISAAIDELIAGAPDTYDTLKEIATYITEHEEVVTALNAAIGNKADASVVTALSEKVTALEGKVHEHANKNILDTISTEPSLYGANGFDVQSGLPTYVSDAVGADYTFNNKIEKIVYNKLGIPMNELGIYNATVGDKPMYLPTMPLIKYTAPDEFFNESELNAYGVTKKQMQSAMTDAITPLTLFLNVASKIADDLKNVKNDVKKIDSLGALASKDKVSTAELDETLTAEVAKIHEHSTKITALETATSSLPTTYVSATQPEGLKNGDVWFKLDE